MPLGITPDQIELGKAIREWAADLEGRALARAAESEPDEKFASTWGAVTEMGLHAVALPDSVGGGDGSVLDQAIVLEACAHELVPGGLLPAVFASLLARTTPDLAARLTAGERAGLAYSKSPAWIADGRITGELSVAWDVPGADLVLLPAGSSWWCVPGSAVTFVSGSGLDLTRRLGTARVDAAVTEAIELVGVDASQVRRTLQAMAAAECAGIARWCLDTAVSYAKVREQFGAPIGSFQSIKHLCAQMLETTEAITAAAWDAANALDEDPIQAGFAAEVAAVTALDGAVSVAEDCIQILGGIGFTFEHDAHLFLRRAVALRALVPSGRAAAARVAELAKGGVRRQLRVDLEGRDASIRPGVRDTVASIAAAADQRVALVSTGYLTPHWAAPYGVDADAVTQLVIDQELAAAGVTRPDLTIGGWALPTIVEHGSDEQRERFVLPTLRGEIEWCQLFSEPGAGSDLAALRTKAERVDGGWRLTGQKVWTSHAGRAHFGICLARTDPEAPKHKGISYFLVDMASDGIDIRPLREMTGDALFNEVFLDGVFVPDDMVVGELGDGWRLTRTTLANERVAMGSARLDKSAEQAVALVSQDGDLEAVGRSVALATVCAQLGVRTTLRSLAGQGPGAESSVAKLLGVKSRQDSSELVVSLLGDALATGGPDVDSAVHEMLLTRCLSIAGGTTQILRNVAAERILGLPR